MAQGVSLADAVRLFEGLTGTLPQSAKELKSAYRAWMKAHHPDITRRHDPLSLEAVQWMNAAYDVLKAHDWTKTRHEPNHTKATADAPAEWTDVRGSSSRSYRSQQRDEQLRRWQEQQEKQREKKEQEHRRWMEEIKQRNEALKRRPLWQKVLWGVGEPAISDDGLSNPGFLWCCWNVVILLLGIGCSTGFGMMMINMIIAILIPELPRRLSYLLDMYDFVMIWAILSLLLLFATTVSGMLNTHQSR
jgi:hypothetical protein